MLRKNYGCVRVDFNQPFSLKVTDIKFTSAVQHKQLQLPWQHTELEKEKLLREQIQVALLIFLKH